MDVHIDLGYTQKLMQFRMFVDKQDQGRALVLNNLLKDSNGELRVTLNSTGLAGRHLHGAHRGAAAPRHSDPRSAG